MITNPVTWGDLKINQSMEGGRCRCHSDMDLVTTTTGDLAVTMDKDEHMRQRMVLWLATPRGEVYNQPYAGCVLHDYIHERMSGSVLARLERDLKQDMQDHFPELGVTSITCNKVSDDPCELQILGRLSEDGIEFFVNLADIDMLSNEFASAFFWAPYI